MNIYEFSLSELGKIKNKHMFFKKKLENLKYNLLAYTTSIKYIFNKIINFNLLLTIIFIN